MIVLFSICGNKSIDKGKKNFFKEKKKRLRCHERLAPYIIDPMNKYKVGWDLVMGLVYLVSYVIDPIFLAFKFDTMEN